MLLCNYLPTIPKIDNVDINYIHIIYIVAILSLPLKSCKVALSKMENFNENSLPETLT